MNNRPLAAFAHPNGNRFHDATAIRFAISRLDVQVDAVQTVGAMVAMFGSGAGANDKHSAVATVKPILLVLMMITLIPASV